MSVVIPTFNHERFVRRAVASALAQTMRSLEVIVIDDGSTDSTRSCLQAIDDPRFTYHYQRNAGLSAARNAGIRRAKGDVVALLDADDLFEPEFLAVGLRYLDAHPDVDAVHTGYRMISEDGSLLAHSCRRVESPGDLLRALLDGNFLIVCSVLVRKTCYQRIGGFDEALTSCEDWDVWLRIARERKLAGVPEILIRYCVTDGAMSTNPRRMLENRLAVLEKNFAADPGPAAELRRRAFGRAYLRSAIEYLQAARPADAERALGNIARQSPELLDETDTFYELAASISPRGGPLPQGHGLRNAAWGRIRWALDVIQPLLSRRAAACAEGAAQQAVALLRFQAGDLAGARTALLRAAQAVGPTGVTAESRLMFLKTFLGKKTLTRLRTLRAERAAS